MSNYFDKKLIKFALVGVLNTIVGCTINLVALNILHLPFLLAGVLNYLPTSIMSFFLNKYFTFKSKGDITKEALRFALNVACCFVLAYGIAEPLTHWALSTAPEGLFDFVRNVTHGLLNEKQSIIDNIATLVGMGLFVVFNYTGQRFFTFRVEQ